MLTLAYHLARNNHKRRDMTDTKPIEYCHLCHKELEFWHTSLKKYEGKKICSSCGTKVAMQMLRDALAEARTQDSTPNTNNQKQDLGTKVTNLGKKLTVGLTFPIILFVLGTFTLPLGVIFWLLGLMLFATLFVKDK